MAQITEDLVYNETHAVNGVSNWDRTTASDDSKASFLIPHGGTPGDNYIIFGLTNLSYFPLSIDSVQIRHESQAGVQAATAVIQIEMLNSSNTQLNQENGVFFNHIDNAQTETVRTTSDGSTAWTENAVNTLRIKLSYITQTFDGAYGAASTGLIDHFFVRVIYTPTAGLIKLNSGLVKLNSGLIKI
tara:strand:+ start:2696 stop:3256 length:561 start_codon:yes stop_codon:yes gene_type:complete